MILTALDIRVNIPTYILISDGRSQMFKKHNMKTIIKILGISLLATIIYIVGSAVMPFSGSFKDISQDSNPTDLIYLLIVHTYITASVFYIGNKSEWNKKWLHYSIILVFIAVYGFITQIETLFFQDSFKALSKSDGWLIMITNVVGLLVIIPQTLTIVKKRYSESKPKIEIKLNVISRKVALLAVIYIFIYFLFGYFVAWQFADVREFYSGTSEKESFIQVMAGNLKDSYIIPFQFLRGFLLSISIIPIVFMFRNRKKELLISLILIFTTTAIVLIIPNALFPDMVRWAHFIEMAISMSLFSIITWLIWQKRNHTN
jgi:hypothetical protein